MNLVAQNQQKIDSLKTVLQTDITDKDKVDILNHISGQYRYTDLNEVVIYSNQAATLARKVSYAEGVVDSYLIIGEANQIIGNYEEATNLYQKTIAFSDSSGFLEGKAYAISYIGKVYKDQGNYEETLIHYFKSLEIFKELEDFKGVGACFNNIGIVYKIKGDYEEALNYYFKALEISEENNKQEDLISDYANIGIVYNRQGNYPLALEYYLKSLKISEEVQDNWSIAANHSNIGNLYFNEEDYSLALRHHTDALEIRKKMNDKKGMASSYTNIGIIHTQLNNIEEALNFHFESLKINEELNDLQNIAINYANIGESYIKQKKYNESIESLKKSLDYSQEIGSKSISNHVLLLLGNSYWQYSQLAQAKDYLKQSLALSEQMGDDAMLRNAAGILAEIESQLGQYKEAYQYHVLFKTTSDSIFNKEKSEQIIDLTLQYETEKKEQQIKDLEQQASIKDLELKETSLYLVILGVTAVLIFLVGVVLYLVFRQRSLVLEKETQSIEQKLLRVQLNPHFIFNALTSIQEYIFNSNKEEASIFLMKFSKLMRQILESSRNEYITLSQEIEMLENYLKLQHLRKPFEHRIVVDENLDTEDIMIPPMFAQPFIENAIEHGILQSNEEGKVEVSFTLKENQVILTIEDNGIGIQKSTEIKAQSLEKHQSLATQITKERISIFKKSFKKNITFEVESLTKGTKIIFRLPYQYA